MSLPAKIDAEIKQAMLAKDAARLGVLRMLKSGIKYAAIEKGGADYQPTDAEVISVVRKEIKKRQDSVESFTKGGRPELADKEKAEIVILNEYLPAPLTEEEIEKIVTAAIIEVGATTKAQMGAVIKAAQARADGRVDGKKLSQVVQKLLV
ncbi:glutamyl-tRNA amidotransferase [Verrucomicrobia bacterium LW23]|nr:glutamyl-tRNA amidotransferase [Verrucomicrobia bacterium LW23]